MDSIGMPEDTQKCPNVIVFDAFAAFYKLYCAFGVCGIVQIHKSGYQPGNILWIKA